MSSVWGWVGAGEEDEAGEVAWLAHRAGPVVSAPRHNLTLASIDMEPDFGWGRQRVCRRMTRKKT